MTVSVVGQHPAFLPDVKRSLRCTVCKRHGGVQPLIYFLAALFRADFLSTLGTLPGQCSLLRRVGLSMSMQRIVLTRLSVLLSGGESFHLLHSLVYTITVCFPS